MADATMRARVQRLLNGNFVSEDLTRLFLFARDRCDGRESVQEIGDFVAHHNVRIKGMVTQSTRDWVTTAKHFSLTPRRGYDPRSLPSNIIEVMHASLRRDHSPSFKLITGLSKLSARKVLLDLCKALVQNPNGTYLLPSNRPPLEWNLAKYLATTIVLNPAFSGDQLFSDFSETLKTNDVLKISEVDRFAEISPAVLLFAISVMNDCLIRIGDGETVKLETKGADSRLHITAQSFTLPLVGVGVIFQTELKASEHCEAALLATPSPWDMALEVKSNMRLGLLA
jgi:hypothetical protein